MIPIVLLFLAAGDPQEWIQKILESARVAEVAVPPVERMRPASKIAPGPPPVLSFRLFQGKERNRYANLDLVIDDAGH